MNISPLKVTVREVVTGYVDDSDREEGIYGYSGRLDIRGDSPSQGLLCESVAALERRIWREVDAG